MLELAPWRLFNVLNRDGVGGALIRLRSAYWKGALISFFKFQPQHDIVFILKSERLHNCNIESFSGILELEMITVRYNVEFKVEILYLKVQI